MIKKTKIVATLGPSSEDPKTLQSLVEAGVNIFRLNTKHSVPAWHREKIRQIEKLNKSRRERVGILVDLQGPEIRLNTKDKQSISLSKGEMLLASTNFSSSVNVILPNEVIQLLNKGDVVLIDDGFVELNVTNKSGKVITLEATENCIVADRKGVNLPSKKLDMPSLSDRDRDVVKELAGLKIDYIALSFARTKTDIVILQKLLGQYKIDASILAKVESQEALDNIDELIAACDGIMVARGDLGVEIPFEQLAFWQSEIIKKCRHASKQVIVATQMLDSMISNPRPTRAEVTDVATAVLQGTDAVMLSGETATGKYPVKTVQTMSRIVKFNEDQISGFKPVLSKVSETELIVNAAMDIAQKDHGPDIDSIVVFSESGLTARHLSRYRPQVPVYAVTDKMSTVRNLTLSFGVTTHYMKFPRGSFRLTGSVVRKLKESKIIEPGQKILLLHGQHWNKEGQKNAMMILNV